jgi:hypothetical protein
MRLHRQGTLNPFERCRPILSLLLVLLFVCNAAGQIRPAEVSRYLRPASRAARAFFPRLARITGGVVPKGNVTFYGPARTKLTPAQMMKLKLVILDREKLRNDEPDFDAVGIRLGANVYRLAVQDDLAYPLMKFIQREGEIAYTLPEDPDADLLGRHGLLKVSGYKNHYVAEEFSYGPHTEFLRAVDLRTDTEELPEALKARVMKGANAVSARALDFDEAEFESYINTDFEVNYQAYFANSDGGKLVEIAGLPLRYFWVADDLRAPYIDNVEVFAYPEEEYDLQYRAILFFQTAAVLREFRRFNKPEFNRFMNEVRAASGGR